MGRRKYLQQETVLLKSKALNREIKLPLPLGYKRVTEGKILTEDKYLVNGIYNALLLNEFIWREATYLEVNKCEITEDMLVIRKVKDGKG